MDFPSNKKVHHDVEMSMTEQEELIMLRTLIEKQKKEIEQKDETIRIRCYEEWLTPIYDRIHEVLMSCEILHKECRLVQKHKKHLKK